MGRGVPESRGGKPRENADDAYATVMEMGERERLMLATSGGMLTPAEQEGLERALTELGLLRLAKDYQDACVAVGLSPLTRVQGFIQHHRNNAALAAVLEAGLNSKCVHDVLLSARCEQCEGMEDDRAGATSGLRYVQGVEPE